MSRRRPPSAIGPRRLCRAAVGVVVLGAGLAHAFSTASVRFYGTGGGVAVDRIRIRVDPPVPADVGAGDFTVELWLRGTLADNVAPSEGYRANGQTESGTVDWIYGNILVDRDLYGDGPDWGMSVHRDGAFGERGVLRFGTESGPPASVRHTLQGRTHVLDGAWHHVAFVRERASGVKRIYVDGVLDAVSALGAAPGDLSYPDGLETGFGDSDPFLVFAAEKHGFPGDGAFPSFSGWLDDVRVWDVARTGAEIQAARSERLPPGTPGLVLHLALEEGAGQALVDATGGSLATLFSGVPGEGEWTADVPPSAAPATSTTSSTSSSTTSTSTSTSTAPPSTTSSSTSSSTSTSATTTSTSTSSSTSTSATTTSTSTSSSTSTSTATSSSSTTTTSSSSSTSSASSTSSTSTSTSSSTTTSTSSTSSSTAVPTTTSTTTTLAAGLVAAWGFDEGTGSTVADGSGNGHAGTVVGAAWAVAGRFGAALAFDGEDDHVTVPDHPALDAGAGAELTLEAWVAPVALDGYRLILDKTTFGVPSNYFLGLLDGEVVFGFFAPDGWHEHASAGVRLSPGAWRHVAAVYSDPADRVRLYVDGVEVLSQAETGSLVANADPLRLGIGFPGEAFGGLIDEIRVYRRALAAGEIQADAATPVSPEPEPDRTPPVLSAGRPSGVLPAGTAQAVLGVETDEPAACRYAAAEGVAWEAMPGTFATTGGTVHETLLADLAAGAHVLNVRCRDAAGNASAVDYPVAFSIAADTTPPAVALASPPEGATVSGTVSLAVAVSDDVGVAGVQYLIDGVPLGPEVAAPPWTAAWDTRDVPAGAHVVGARARDAAGNVGLASATVTVAHAPVGLVAAFGFEEGAGTVVGDASGNGNVGVVAGAAWTAAGRFGRALAFDGVDDWVTVADAPSLALTGEMTLEAWVNPTTEPAGWRTVLAKEGTVENVWFLHAASDVGDAPAAGVVIGGAERVVAGASRLPAGRWTHLAATYDGAAHRLYVDGVLVAERPQSGPVAASAGPLRLGGNAVFGERFAGLVDEVRVYRRALSGAEIRDDMSRPVSP